MSRIDAGEFRRLLEAERTRIGEVIGHLHDGGPRNLDEELGELAGHAPGNHLADMASATFTRPRRSKRMFSGLMSRWTMPFS